MSSIKQRVKVYFQDNQGEEVRRFSLNTKSITLKDFVLILMECRSDIFPRNYHHWNQVLQFSYQDDENDWVTFSTEMEWKEALEVQPLNSIMRLKVSLKPSKKSPLNDDIPIHEIKKIPIEKKPYLKRTKPEDYVLGCMRNNPKPVPKKKIIKPVVKFNYLKKTPVEKYVLACMRSTVNQSIDHQRKKKKYKRSKGFTFSELCDFLNFPKKQCKPMKQKKLRRKKKSKYSVQMNLLAQMGFTDTKKCLELCEKYNGNLNTIVNNLLM